MIVVSDTSPVANLLLINQLGLLQQAFNEIIIPTAVHTEIMHLRQLGRDITEYEQAGWIKIQDAENHAKSTELKQHLDEGESEAIALHWKFIVI